jgi:protein-disulfide isomerase
MFKQFTIKKMNNTGSNINVNREQNDHQEEIQINHDENNETFLIANDSIFSINSDDLTNEIDKDEQENKTKYFTKKLKEPISGNNNIKPNTTNIPSYTCLIPLLFSFFSLILYFYYHSSWRPFFCLFDMSFIILVL